MRKFSLILLAATIVFGAVAAQADTIYLKNGSVIKGKVASFADDQFVVMLSTGSDRFTSRATIFIGDVSRIEFDQAGAMSAETPRDTTPAPQTSTQPAPSESTPPETMARESQPRETQPRETQPRPAPVTEQPSQPAVESSQPERQNPPAAEAESSHAQRKLSGPVKTVSIDVNAKRDWVSTGLIVKRGDVIRVTATGTVTLDPVQGVTAGPEGIDQADPKKLMQDRPTGALIAVIGADNDDFIFIGRSAEFTAARDGLLFLSVNEGTLADNSGSFKTSIELQSQKVAGR